jgi:hypothetical protein
VAEWSDEGVVSSFQFPRFSVQDYPSPTTNAALPLPLSKFFEASDLIDENFSVLARKSGKLRILDQTADPRTQLRLRHVRLRSVEKEGAGCPRKVGPIAERAELSAQEWVHIAEKVYESHRHSRAWLQRLPTLQRDRGRSLLRSGHY